MSLAEQIRSTSFLEHAFLRWVLTPAACPTIAQFVVPQATVHIGGRSYRLDYEVTGSLLRVAVELDGFAFHSERDAFTYDRLRQNDLQTTGRSILRYSYDSIRRETRRCVEQLQSLLRQDPALAPHLIEHPDVEVPSMDPDAGDAFCLPPTVSAMPSQSYFEDARSRLRLKPLRRCQQEAFVALSRYYRDGGRRAACVMAVGAGKTALGVAACLAFTRRRALIVTPGSIILGAFGTALDPSSSRNALYTLPGGALIPGTRAPRTLVLDRSDDDFPKDAICEFTRDELLENEIIATNFQALGHAEDENTLLGKLRPDDIDFLVIDEAHIAAAESYLRLLRHFTTASVLLMSACFRRMDGKPIDADVVYRYRLIDSIADGSAKNIRFRRFAPDAEATEYEVRWPDGRNEQIVGREAVLDVLKDEKKLARVTARSEVPIRAVMKEVRRALNDQRDLLRPLKPRVLFSALGERHAEQVARVAREEGITCVHVHHSMGSREIARIRERYESSAGDLEGLVHLRMFGQGYDFPQIAVVAPLRPYASFGEFYQFVGRGIRFIHDPRLVGRFGPGEQVLDVVYHAELDVDEHVQDLYRENELDPVPPESANVAPEGSDASIGVETEGGAAVSSPDARVVFQRGIVAAHMIHDAERIAQLRAERELSALAQQYAEYAAKSQRPIPFSDYVQFRKDLHG